MGKLAGGTRYSRSRRFRGIAMKQLMKQLLHDESGQDLIEYALVATVIALGAVASMTSLAGAIGNGLNSVGNNFNSNV